MRPVLALLLAALLGPAPVARALDTTQAEREVIARSNAFRASEGLPPVQAEPRLTEAARAFARYLADTGRFAHEADGRRPTDRAAAQGYAHCLVAENIALEGHPGPYTPAERAEAFVAGWIGSAGHRANLLTAGATDTGVGIAHVRTGRMDRYLAVQMFGRPESLRTTFEIGNRTRGTVAYRVGEHGWTLTPGLRRTHVLCGAEPLVVELGRGAPWRETPADGARYTVEARPGGGTVVTPSAGAGPARGR